jgi:serine/threonine-protein kinase HipA
MTKELIALLDGKEVGRVQRDRLGRLAFVYDEDGRQAADAYPLSLSMPLGAQRHGHAIIDAFLWGLLPDNELVLARWAAKFHVSARVAFALLSHVGEDCAGAIQFVTPERLEAMRTGQEDNVEWIDEAEIAKRLKTLREDHAAWRLPRDTGQFSLAGAQPKTALRQQNGRWGIPSGRLATTHILKPPTGHFEGHAENEHICLKLARDLGLPTALSTVERFGDEVAIVIERYDRLQRGSDVVRIHQEDMCQAHGVMPTKKYQNQGGPSAVDIIGLLRINSTARDADLDAFVGALGFNWIIGGTDAHAKNFSLLLGAGSVRLAPLYDVASILPYEKVDFQKLKLAMKVGGEYKLALIGLPEWEKFAREGRLDRDAFIERLVAMASALPDHVNDARVGAEKDGLQQQFVERLAKQLIERAGQCRELLKGA